MSERAFELWRRWLLCVCAGMVLFGLLLVVADTRLMGPFNESVSQSLWGVPVMPEQVVAYHRFVHGVEGATIAGWALTMLFVVQHPFRRRERWAWWALFSGPAVWFCLDAATTIYHGVWANLALNVGSYLPLVLPLVFTRSAFKSPDETPLSPAP